MLACGSISAYTLGVSTRSIPLFSLLNPKPFFKSVWGSYDASFFSFLALKMNALNRQSGTVKGVYSVCQGRMQWVSLIGLYARWWLAALADAIGVRGLTMYLGRCLVSTLRGCSTIFASVREVWNGLLHLCGDEVFQFNISPLSVFPSMRTSKMVYL